MDVFQLRDEMISDYKSYVTSFMALRDPRIKMRVDNSLQEGRLWPEPRIGLNPAFESGGSVDQLVDDGLLHAGCRSIFRVGKSKDNPIGTSMRLHRHQVDAIHEARAGHNYVLTTGTGSGKSLAYIIPIVDHVLRNGTGKGIQAIVVYPMNALANSQEKELEKFLDFIPGGKAAVRIAKYTGQEKGDEREAILQNPPDVILTNYVMLELILTRIRDQRLVRNAQGLKFLVLDELHTYRGRQGADVAMLVRRVREACNASELQCIGTSATLSTEGTHQQQKSAVASVASLLFGATVDAESVIGETLRRATPALDHTDPAVVDQLRQRLLRGEAGCPTTLEEHVTDPLSSWIESALGIQSDGMRLVRMTPRPIGGKGGAAEELAQLVGTIDSDRCGEVIRAQLMVGNRAQDPPASFRSFAFRLHQFISRGDTVFASPEVAKDRYLTLNGQRFVPGHRKRVLLPLSFCRLCGQDHYTVRRLEPDEKFGTRRFVPRDMGDQQKSDSEVAGFLVLDEGDIWSDDLDAVLERVPEDWIEEAANGTQRIKSASKTQVPVAVHVDTSGAAVESGGTRMWWVPAPFRMCLRCGASYDARTRSDIAKLTTLGSEGRSTATTVLSLATIRSLRKTDLEKDAKKLLSFTDNRQDASLQAGHFNDFIQTTMLRAALHRAVVDAGPNGLEYDRVAEAVFKAIALPLAEYAVDANVEFAARIDTERALRDVLGYLTYLDLRRGWRITSPNLEQCALLHIGYQSLTELCASEDVWYKLHPVLAGASREEREYVCTTLLDYLRRELAIKVDYLDTEFQERLVQRSSQRLAGMWSVDDQAQLVFANAVLPRSRVTGDFRGWSYLSSLSGFGRFVRRPSTFASYGQKIKRADADQILPDLFAALGRAGLVEKVNEAHDGTGCYQVPASALLWKVGDGVTGYRDPVRMPRASSSSLGPNEFFVDLYKSVARDLVGMEGREHTAQVSYEDREDREERFRRADLPVLYCSPTMELGVDIADLNVVNMRNVPPTPANYAQRSGRAGRSGQPALVYTYCAAGSPHDQWFFNRPQLMVAGQVSTPRLDITNEDLVRAHVQAVWLAQSGLSLGSSLTEVLDITAGSVPQLFDRVKDVLRDPALRLKAKAAAERVLADVRTELEAATWWSPTWLDDVLNATPKAFESATERWVGLYRSAKGQFDAQNLIIGDVSATPDAKKQAKRLWREAVAQLALLAAEEDTRNQSDFYSYRYFASEGFLPGYSFPRLPLSAFVPGRRGRVGADGEFLSRPRFLAISEFGPRSLIYHEGNRYEVNRVILPVTDQVDASGDPVLTTTAKWCESCSYLHPAVGGVAVDVCEHCGAPLPPAVSSLFRMHNVATRRRDRISADEEERQRQGFETHTALRFADRHGNLSIRSGEAKIGDAVIGRLTYGDTATIWRINLGRRRRAHPEVHGFVLDIDKGYWGKEDDDPNDGTPSAPRTQRVIPFVEDSRNCLIFEPAEPQPPEVMASLEAALKSAIQVVFQLEENELASEPLPSRGERRRLLFFESAEGGAGVLRRLVDDQGALARVAKHAIELCHIDPVSGADIPTSHGEECEAACYDCLLSYRNQLDHELLDRRVVHDILIALASTTVSSAPGNATPEQHQTELESQVDSGLEKQFLDFLRGHNLHMPEQGQVLIGDARTRPDFVYRNPDVAIYVDGPDHLYPERQRRDATQQANLRDMGWTVIRFSHLDDWAQTVDNYRWVFGEMAE